MIVLDTDLMSLSQFPDAPAAFTLYERLKRIPQDEQLAVSIVSYEEQTRGWLAFAARAKSSVQIMRAYHRLYDHLIAYRDLYVLEFDLRASAIYDDLRAKKIRIGALDLRIAAIALSQDALLLSRNLKDFSRVPNLKVEDWTQPPAPPFRTSE